MSTKCLRCSDAILDGDLVVFDHGDLIHVRCCQITTTADRIRESRLLAERSRQRLKESQERIERVLEALGANPDIACVVCQAPLSSADLVIMIQGVAHRGCVSPA